MAKKRNSRRVYDDDFKAKAVQMLLDGHSASSVAKRLGVPCPTTVRRWKRKQLQAAGPVADAIDNRVRARGLSVSVDQPIPISKLKVMLAVDAVIAAALAITRLCQFFS